MLDHITKRRLAFIKYLYKNAISQSHKPSPLNCASLLTMHDAIESFLYLACECHDKGSKNPGLMDYFDNLNREPNPIQLGQKAAMRRLNRARVALKHYGTFPTDLDLESYRATTTNFFKDNTPIVFNIDMSDISLIEFVNPESSRDKLREAKTAISQDSVGDALEKIAIAFEEMIIDYEERKTDLVNGSPFHFGEDPSYLDDFGEGLIEGLGPLEERFKDFVGWVKGSTESIQGTIKILAFGLDYRKYAKFKRLTPQLTRMADRHWSIDRRSLGNYKPNVNDARFCLDFVIESALALSDFDYTLPHPAG